MPDDKWKTLGDFKVQPINARRHRPEGINMLGNAIADVGYVAPMNAAADGTMFDGSSRLLTALLSWCPLASSFLESATDDRLEAIVALPNCQHRLVGQMAQRIAPFRQGAQKILLLMLGNIA